MNKGDFIIEHTDAQFSDFYKADQLLGEGKNFVNNLPGGSFPHKNAINTTILGSTNLTVLFRGVWKSLTVHP